MISANYIANLFRTHRVGLAAAFVFVAAFQLLMMFLVETLDLPSMLQGVFRMFPEPAQQLFGDQFIADFSVSGIVALAYDHPLILVTLLLVGISVPVRSLAGAVERGTLELLFTMPVPRLRIGLSLWLATGAFLLILLFGCWLGTALGFALFPETRDLHVVTFLRLGLNLWLLTFVVSSYALLISSYAREGAPAGQLAAGVTLFFFFLDYAVKIWPEIEVLGTLSPFHYYDPQGMLRGEAPWVRNLLVLFGVALVSGSIALLRLQHRDVP